MKNLEIKNVEYCLEDGFFWVEFESGKSLQCCLKQEEDGAFIKAIVEHDSGHDWGICLDVNEWAKDDEQNLEHVNAFLVQQAKKAGLEIH